MHPFESKGLGRPPFSLKAVDFDAPQRCQFCNQQIKRAFYVESSDGNTFVVGSDCVRKTGDPGLMAQSVKAIKDAKQKSEEQRIALAEKRLAISGVRDQLSRFNSPGWSPNKDESALDWCVWMMANSGVSGKMKVARYLEAIQLEEPLDDS